MSGRTRVRNQARLVKCQGCRLLVWLAGALPQVGDSEFVCSVCSGARAEEAT